MDSFRMLARLAILALFVIPASAQSPFAFTCAEDTHIDPTNHKVVDALALSFIELILGPNPSAAYDSLSRDARAEITPEQLGGQALAIIKQFEPKGVALQHTYFIELKGNSPGRVVCAKDLSRADGWESLAAANVPQQAHVVMTADSTNNKLAITVWLVPEQDKWKVQSFWVSVSSLADKDSIQLWELARTQQARGHNFNAALLYAAAAQTANRGSNFQMGIVQSISEDISNLTIPPEVRGQPPFAWKSKETTYKLLSVGPIAVGGKIYVIMAHEVSPWRSDDQVDGWNKGLLQYFKLRFPEYSDTFAGLVAHAIERGSNRRYGTVEELPAQK
jgi:hypothetical protein